MFSVLGKTDKDVSYTWDNQNRLAQINYHYTNRPVYLSAVPDNTLNFTYDDSGNRTKKQTSNGTITYYLNSGNTVLNEIGSTGTTTKSMVYGLSPIAEIDTNNIITYTHQDTLGSTVLTTDQSGNVVTKYEYDPFGQLIGQDGISNTNYLYTGQEYDQESDLYYYNARYYNPRLGRFISRDPYLGRDGDSLSRNGYTYVKNNPLKYVDPTGQIDLDTMWEGTKQTFWGAVDATIGVATAVGGVAVATGGTATGVGAVPGIAVGVAAVGFGTNNVVAGSTKAWGGITNLWNGIFDDKKPAVDYTYNPASEAINSLISEDSGWNTAAHVVYDVVDIAISLKATPSALSALSNENKTLFKTENTLIKANAGVKPDISILSTTKGGSPAWRYHLGYHPIAGSSPFWHLGLEGDLVKSASNVFGSSAGKIHLPFAPIAEVIAGIGSYFSHGNEAYAGNK